METDRIIASTLDPTTEDHPLLVASGHRFAQVIETAEGDLYLEVLNRKRERTALFKATEVAEGQWEWANIITNERPDNELLEELEEVE